MHTLAADEKVPENPLVKASKWKVWIAEADPELRRALAHWLPDASGDPGLPLAAQINVPAPTAANGLVLAIVNRDLAEKLKLPTADELTVLPSGLPVLPYSVYPSSEELFRLCPGRLFSYLFKRLRPQAMLEPVHNHFSSGFTSLGTLEQTARTYFHSLLETPQPPQQSKLPETLTQRERDVLVLLSRGCVDKEIARLLGISSWTVHEHVKRIFDKLHVHSRVEAALAYLQK
jgi:DNA-binding NarL/FixJ family response regulator